MMFAMTAVNMAERGPTDFKEATKKSGAAKKCGAENGDPNRHSQPRLPGSVVGEASMRQGRKRHKITKVRDLR